MDENKPQRASKPRFVNDSEYDDVPAKAKRGQKSYDYATKKRSYESSQISPVMILQQLTWGGFAFWTVSASVYYESLMAKASNVMQELSFSGLFIARGVMGFAAAFAICQFLKMFERKQPIEVYTAADIENG